MRNIGFLCLILLLLAATDIFAQNEPEWQWVMQAGGTSSESGDAIALGLNGNSYVTGYFYGTSCFGPISLTSNGNSDIYISKMDTNGNWVWAIQAGGTYFDAAKCVAVDSSDNVYVAGYFSETATFGSITLSSDGGWDIFVAKADSSGNWLWAKSAGETNDERGLGIAVDGAGGIYLTGYFENIAYFGPFPLTSWGDSDIFIARLDMDGNWLWALNAGGAGSDVGRAIALCGNEHVCITGSFTETAMFGNTALTSSGGKDIFVAKLDANGNWLWARKTSGASDESAHGIAVDSYAAVYLTGRFRGAVYFGNTSLSSSGLEDCFVAKLDCNGNWQWAVRAGGSGQDFGESVAVDNATNVYLTGYFQEIASFGSTSFTCIGYVDIFIAKLGGDGNWHWAMQAGGTNYDLGLAIAVDCAYNIYHTGYFWGTVNFGTISLSTNGAADVFVSKLSPGEVSLSDDISPETSGLSRLYELYPNPLRKGNPVSIKTYVSDIKGGTLSLFNLRGQCLSSHILQPGTHQTSLVTRGLPPGVYFYKFETQTVKIIRKLVLVN